MRIKAVAGDFVVEERADLALARSGPWAAYRVRKVGISTLEVQTRLASHLGLPRARVVFPALKDKAAIAVQFVTLPAGLASIIEGESFIAQRIGYRARPLSPRDLTGNAFTITVRDLEADQANLAAHRLSTMDHEGLPNYFDQQRFGSYAPGWGYIGKAILMRDAQEALRAYLTRPFLGDPRPVRAFKRKAQSLWPDWMAMVQVAPRPSNWRSVLTYLVDHPEGYRKALNLIPQRLLSLYLSAYQSYLWNRIAAIHLGRFCADLGAVVRQLTIAGQSLPVPMGLSERTVEALTATTIALPHHRAQFRLGEIAGIARDVLAEEELSLVDLKARILKRAYLSKGDRPLLILPRSMDVDGSVPDERFQGRWTLRVRFELPRGSYATLVIKAALC